MKHLIIYSHFNANSFTKAIVDRVEDIAITNKDEIKIIDLYGDLFSPVFNLLDVEYAEGGKSIPADVKEYQDLVAWADHYSFVFPLWWGQMPAMMKGFMDRVLTNGFAFQFDDNGYKALLSDKTAKVFINTGSPSKVYEEMGMHKSIKQIIDQGVLGFCGISTEIIFFGEVPTIGNTKREEYLRSIV